MLARHGLHFGLDVNARWKRTPSRATRSKFGVLTHLLPYTLGLFQFMSSKMTNRMLGRGASAAGERGCVSAPSTATATVAAVRKRMAVILRDEKRPAVEAIVAHEPRRAKR